MEAGFCAGDLGKKDATKGEMEAEREAVKVKKGEMKGQMKNENNRMKSKMMEMMGEMTN